ncbi:MAG: hypothetical protein A2481_04195 [Candidatus Yonathbacteria bacterium RIFOXYC2_FULL_47_9]|nr:MAG: hypothetical protein A2481_04195 [Candidatus Yonathbacteria bacterium RIFOXYC2_FULL_47_9]HAT68819.1 hypothetical protein [Candidatus Yonathbacteria bacterium]
MAMEIQAGCDQCSPNPEFVSPDGYDLCVHCGAKTPYKTETHIDARIGYVEGVGQTCPNGCKTKEEGHY